MYEQKDESNSIRTQRLLLHNYISERDDLQEFQIIEYVDDGYSGKNFDRPEFKRLLNDVRKNRIHCIIVKDFSRLGRDYVEVGNYIEKVFPFMGIRFIAVNNHFDSIMMKTGEVPDMDFSFQNLIYDYYSVENSIKTKTVKENRRQAGKYMSVYAPYGYVKDPQDKNHLIIDEEAAIQVRNIFEWYLEGKTKADIARILDTKGVLTPAQYMTAKGSNYNWRYKKLQGKWCGAIIGRILSNRIYTGTLVSGKTEVIEIGGKRVRYKNKDEWCIVENIHQPIIPKGLYKEVQKYNKSTLINKVSYKSSGSDSILKGYLRCGGCKHKLTRRDRSNVSYYCRYHYELHDDRCIKGNIYEDSIIKIILDTIRKQIVMAGNIEYLSAVRGHLEQRKKGARKANSYSVGVEMKKLKNDNFHIYELFRLGEIEKNQYLELKSNNTKQLKALEDTQLEYNDDVDDYSVTIHKEQTFLDALEVSGNLKWLTKDLVDSLIEMIEVYPGDRLVIHFKHKSICSLTPDKRD